MPLHTLIDKYQTDLAIPTGTGIKEIVEGYRPFGQDLVKLSSFTYTKYDMLAAVIHMMDLDFSHDARKAVALYAMRRAATEAIPDTNVREEIWGLLELGPLWVEEQGMQKIKLVTEEYVKRIGKSEVEEYLLMVQEGFENVSNEVKEVYKMVSRVSWPREVAENHGALIALEIMELQDILKIVKAI